MLGKKRKNTNKTQPQQQQKPQQTNKKPQSFIRNSKRKMEGKGDDNTVSLLFYVDDHTQVTCTVFETLLLFWCFIF